MTTALISLHGNYKATFGRAKDGTYSVTTWMVGGGEYPDLPTFKQTGFPTMEAAREWASADLQSSEEQNAPEPTPEPPAFDAWWEHSA